MVEPPVGRATAVVRWWRVITVRQWGPTTFAVYRDDGNPLGGYLRRVLSESDPVDCIALQRIRRVARRWKGTRVREYEDGRAGVRPPVAPGLDSRPSAYSDRSKPAVTLPASTDNNASPGGAS